MHHHGALLKDGLFHNGALSFNPAFGGQKKARRDGRAFL
jgi:hypothetical protein